MRRERRLPTQGSAFCRILDKSGEWDNPSEIKANKEWQQVLMVYNLAKRKNDFTKPPGFGLPGGGVLTIETPIQGMLRELYEETGRVFIKAEEKMKWLLSSLNRLTVEIETRDEGSSYLKMAIESRLELIREYAELVQKLRLIRKVRTENDPEALDTAPLEPNTQRQILKPPVWIFEADAKELFVHEDQADPERMITRESSKEGPNHCTLVGYKETRASSRNDLAKNTEFAMWITRTQLAEIAGNFKRFADHDQTRVYAGHLRRLDLEITRSSER